MLRLAVGFMGLVLLAACATAPSPVRSELAPTQLIENNRVRGLTVVPAARGFSHIEIGGSM